MKNTWNTALSETQHFLSDGHGSAQAIVQALTNACEEIEYPCTFP